MWIGRRIASFYQNRPSNDHPKPGHAALVVEAQIGGFSMSKVFMDDESGLNLIFASIVRNMGITIKMLEESDTCFQGIIPTLPAHSLGKIFLNVIFGKPDNFRKEGIKFEVVNGSLLMRDCN
jgi:hypothetical protein